MPAPRPEPKVHAPREQGARAARHEEAPDLAADVRSGLGRPQKTLPSKYLYDPVGAALFEAITELPEYGLTRAEERILEREAHDIARRLPHGVTVAELGAGSGRKTVAVLDAILAHQPGVSYTTIDLSASAQARCALELGARPGVRFRAIEASYLQGLARFEAGRPMHAPLLVVFLGSSIGNFDPLEQRAFLRGVRALMRPGDALLLGADLVKSVDRLLLAYDDPAGVTAAFDLNLLARINRELSADFDLRAFRHEARWSAPEQRVEMHLRSLRAQTVRVAGAGCRVEFAEGETIWTESSHKFAPERLPRLALSSGFVETARWVDAAWPFADALWLAERADA
jgi:L-histidine N-alpha-methyltransferase